MSEKDFSKKIRESLQNLWDETLSDATKQLKLSKEQGLFDLIGARGDEVDLSSIGVDREIDYTLVDIYNKRLLEIREALDRLDRDEYSFCEECGERINSKRLEVLPFARCCLECQGKIEIQEKARDIL
jgi:DnaK suppressor protein